MQTVNGLNAGRLDNFCIGLLRLAPVVHEPVAVSQFSFGLRKALFT